MKLSDYVAGFLKAHGVDHVFGLTGGAVVHLFDSVAKRSDMQAIFTHHEQAASYAAEAYARVRNSLGAAFVTTGPGGTNALTGLCAAWLDSIPCVFISGQTRLAHTTRNKPIRQVGTQQFDIIQLAAPMTKYAVMLEDPARIRYELEKAVYIARTGRPGPVWIDLPLDFQWASVEPDRLEAFIPEPQEPPRASIAEVSQCLALIDAAERPLIVAGNGIRFSRGEAELNRLLVTTGIPFVSTWSSTDLPFDGGSVNVGRPGIFGQRGANLAVQNCDLLLSIGSHLCVPITGTMFQAFARGARIVMVDIDPAELAHANVRLDLAIRSDAKLFLESLVDCLESSPRPAIDPWRDACAVYASRYNSVPADWHRESSSVNPYVLVDLLSDTLTADDVVVVDGGGTINQITFQTLRTKPGQRLVISAALCAMGSGLPESVGACVAAGGRRTICLCGDGSFQLNVQELQTIVHHQLPIKIFLINNDGYLSIRHTQQGFLEGRFAGSAKTGGLSLPDVRKVAAAYDVPSIRVANHGELKQQLAAFLDAPGPGLCEVMVSKDAQVSPRQGFMARADGTFAPQPLENMAPFLDRDEFLQNMFVAAWTE